MKSRRPNLTSFAASTGLMVFALLGVMVAAMALLHPASAAPKPPAGGFTTLYSFCQQTNCADGMAPYSGVTVTSAGTLFGSTCEGGKEGDGVLFSLTKKGVETVRATLTDATGVCPVLANLSAKSSSEFFGTTASGGANGRGTVFGLTQAVGSTWTLTVLYNFGANPDDGCTPQGGLVMDKKGNLYGTTYLGGANYNDNCQESDLGCGTVFELSPPAKSKGKWIETVLYNFCESGENCTDGANPSGTLVMDKSGTLYGTTAIGGDDYYGTLFAISAYGAETVLYSFCQQANCADGNQPIGNLAMDAKGNLYGTTLYGGTGYYEDDVYYGGTVFKFSAKGIFSVLYSFCSDQSGDCTDGNYPAGGVIVDKSGNIYGETSSGGTTSTGSASGSGVVFEILYNAGEAVLHNFGTAGPSDGSSPFSALSMDAKGNLYGTTQGGGTDDRGTVFVLTP